MEAADDNGNCVCVTCGRVDHYKRFHAGHFIGGRTNAVLFDERGINPQCVRCNAYLNGNPSRYEAWMIANHGEAVVAELREARNRVVQYTREDLCEMRGVYRSRIKTQKQRLGE